MNGDALATDVDQIARQWLAEMESCVRAVDFERCRAIFADDVVAFGSRAAMVVGLDALEEDQWRQIWPAIREFTFVTDRLRTGAGEGDLIWLACPWTSLRQDDTGRWQPRPGRMTAVLAALEGRWLAIHTHHSLEPAREGGDRS
jgi:ketosteroid isomerase-like protein